MSDALEQARQRNDAAMDAARKRRMESAKHRPVKVLSAWEREDERRREAERQAREARAREVRAMTVATRRYEKLANEAGLSPTQKRIFLFLTEHQRVTTPDVLNHCVTSHESLRVHASAIRAKVEPYGIKIFCRQLVPKGPMVWTVEGLPE